MVCFAAPGDLLDKEIDAGYINIYIYIYIYVSIYVKTLICCCKYVFQKWGQIVPTDSESILHAPRASHVPRDTQNTKKNGVLANIRSIYIYIYIYMHVQRGAAMTRRRRLQYIYIERERKIDICIYMYI